MMFCQDSRKLAGGHASLMGQVRRLSFSSEERNVMVVFMKSSLSSDFTFKNINICFYQFKIQKNGWYGEVLGQRGQKGVRRSMTGGGLINTIFRKFSTILRNFPQFSRIFSKASDINPPMSMRNFCNFFLINNHKSCGYPHPRQNGPIHYHRGVMTQKATFSFLGRCHLCCYFWKPPPKKKH